MKLSQIAYTHVLELLELFHIFLEMLNFGSKFEIEHSIRMFSQTTHSNGMKISQISHIDILKFSVIFPKYFEQIDLVPLITKSNRMSLFIR
jgi:hypothetical protein